MNFNFFLWVLLHKVYKLTTSVHLHVSSLKLLNGFWWNLICGGGGVSMSKVGRLV